MKELLIKLRNYLIDIPVNPENPKEWKIVQGLCHAIVLMHHQKMLSNEELYLLTEFIENNRPKFYQKHFSWNQIGSSYYWSRYLWKFRILWVDDEILKLEKKDL